MSLGALLITEERHRQQSQEGWSNEDDDAHVDKELAFAASAHMHHYFYGSEPIGWPKDWEWKDHHPIRELVISGALIAAEIDRLLRLREKQERESRHTDNSDGAQAAQT